MQLLHKAVGLLQISVRSGILKTLLIHQVFSQGLKNKFKTQMADSEVWTDTWGINLEHPLTYGKITPKSAKRLVDLRFSAGNIKGDKTAIKVGSAIILDCNRYPSTLKTWNVEFFKGESGQLLISKRVRKTYRSVVLLEPGAKPSDLFDHVESVNYEDLHLDGIGDIYDIVQKNKNFLLFFPQKQEVEEKEEKVVSEESIVVSKVLSQKETTNTPALAESIISEQDDAKVDVISEALKACDIKAHACRVAIADYLYNRVYVEKDTTVTRPQIIAYVLENYSWSQSTVYRHIGKLEREGFIQDIPNQEKTTQEFKIVGFDLRFEQTIRDLCKEKGWSFGGKLSSAG